MSSTSSRIWNAIPTRSAYSPNESTVNGSASAATAPTSAAALNNAPVFRRANSIYSDSVVGCATNSTASPSPNSTIDCATISVARSLCESNAKASPNNPSEVISAGPYPKFAHALLLPLLTSDRSIISSTTSEALCTHSTATAKSTAALGSPPHASHERIVTAGRTRLPPANATWLISSASVDGSMVEMTDSSRSSTIETRRSK